MAFTLSCWARVDVGISGSFTINFVNGAGTAEGNEGLFQYNGDLADDTVAEIVAANYFLPVVGNLQLGSVIFVSASDGNGMYQVNAITYPDTDGIGGAVTVASYGPGGSVATANIQDHAVTYVKMQQASADTLIGNPTGGAHDVEEITLGNGLGFTGTTVQVLPSNLIYQTGSITSTAFKAMYATPIVLVAAGGANTLFDVADFVLETNYASTQYASGGAIAVQYDSTVHGAGAPASATIAAATVNGYAADAVIAVEGSLASATAAATVNKGLYLSNATGAFDTGDSTFNYHLWYRKVTTSF